MKKIVMMVLAATTMLLACSCKNEKALFDLSVNGDIFTENGVAAQVSAQVSNAAPYYFYRNGTPIANYDDLSAKDKERIDKWIDRFVAKQVRTRIPNGAKWQVHIKGYLKYYVTIEIDRTFPE